MRNENTDGEEELSNTAEALPDQTDMPVRFTALNTFLMLIVPVTTWIVVCGGIALLASTLTFQWLAILIGLLAGTVIFMIWVATQGASTVVELNCASVILLILALILLPVFFRARQKALQQPVHSTQLKRTLK